MTGRPMPDQLADEYLSGDYTIQETTFTDGDSRTKLIHSYGWSATNYLQEILWVDRGEIWLEYYEGDIRRLRETFDIEEYPGYEDWIFGNGCNSPGFGVYLHLVEEQ